MTKVSKWAQDFTEKHFGPAPLFRVGDTVTHPSGRKVKITSGQYWGERGISNFWRWREVFPDGSLGEMEDIMLEKARLDCHHLFGGLILQADIGLDHMIVAVPCLSCNRRGPDKKGGIWKLHLHQVYPGKIARNCFVLMSLESFMSKMKS